MSFAHEVEKGHLTSASFAESFNKTILLMSSGDDTGVITDLIIFKVDTP